MLRYHKLDDEAWFRKIAGTKAAPLFGLPDPIMQKKTVGKTGHDAMRDGWMFWRFVRIMAARHGYVISQRTTILDFGVAWGRILRYFLRDTEAYYLAGVDVTAVSLAEARLHLPQDCDLRLSKSAPPLPYCDNSFDIIYAFSVFSQLPKHIADAWAVEFRRILKPNGIVCLTTRPKRHLQTDQCRRFAGGDVAGCEALYDDGEYVFLAEGGGVNPKDDSIGEAIIPPDYIRKNWPLELVAFHEQYAQTYMQPCFVLRRL